MQHNLTYLTCTGWYFSLLGASVMCHVTKSDNQMKFQDNIVGCVVSVSDTCLRCWWPWVQISPASSSSIFLELRAFVLCSWCSEDIEAHHCVEVGEGCGSYIFFFFPVLEWVELNQYCWACADMGMSWPRWSHFQWKKKKKKAKQNKI